MERIREWKKQIKIVVGLFLFCLVSTITNAVHINDRYIHLVEILVVLVFTVGFFALAKANEIGHSIVFLLVLGYIVRFVYMLLSFNSGLEAVMPYGYADGPIFFERAKEMYLTGNSTYYTWYVYVVLGIFQVFGLSRMIAQYLNIVCYLVASLVLVEIFKKLEIEEKWKRVGIALFSFFPNYIFISSLLMRESLIILLVLLSFWLFLCWKEKGEIKSVIGVVFVLLPACIMHSGCFILVVGYIFVFLFYNREQKRCCITKRTCWGLGIATVIFIILWFSPMHNVLFAYFYKELDWRGIAHLIESRNHQIAGANYLTHQEINGPWDLLIYLPLRMLYFQISPMPWNWRGITDAVAFIIDSGTYIVALFCVISMLIKKKKDRIIPGLIGLQMILFAAMHGWGVMNAGTAMRHRCKLLGLAVIAIVYYLQNRKLPENEQG